MKLSNRFIVKELTLTSREGGNFVVILLECLNGKGIPNSYLHLSMTDYNNFPSFGVGSIVEIDIISGEFKPFTQ